MTKLRFWLMFSHHAFSQSTRHKCTACPLYSSSVAIWRTHRLATCSCSFCRRSLAARHRHLFSRMTCPAGKQHKRGVTHINCPRSRGKGSRQNLVTGRIASSLCKLCVGITCLADDEASLLAGVLAPRIFPEHPTQIHGLPFAFFFSCDLANSLAGNVFLHFVQTIIGCEAPSFVFADDVSCKLCASKLCAS